MLLRAGAAGRPAPSFTGTGVWIDLERGRYWVLLTNRVHPSRHTASGIDRLRRAFNHAAHGDVEATHTKSGSICSRSTIRCMSASDGRVSNRSAASRIFGSRLTSPDEMTKMPGSPEGPVHGGVDLRLILQRLVPGGVGALAAGPRPIRE